MSRARTIKALLESFNDYETNDDEVALRVNHRFGMRCLDCGRMLSKVTHIPATRTCPNDACGTTHKISKSGRSLLVKKSKRDLQEKWGVKDAVNPAEKGKYDGVSPGQLRKQYAALKASGPHKHGTPEFGKMRELAFALRAKRGWGTTGT